MTRVVPDDWMPIVPMKRLIGHWTAGRHKANDTDRRAYHLLVEGDGNMVRGVPSIIANSGSLKSGYAAHTLNCNTDSIGVSMCGMHGATEVPWNPGAAPLTKVQWERFVAASAELAQRYKIPIGPKTTLFHAEVQPNLGITQRWKWDVIRLPFDPSVVGAKAVGDKWRREMQAYLAGAGTPAPLSPEEPVPAGATGRVTASSLNFRNAPNGAIVGELRLGHIVEIVGSDGAWLNVLSPAGFPGWVHRDFVDVIDGPPTVEPTKPDPLRARIVELRRILDRLDENLPADRAALDMALTSAMSALRAF